jgi:putative colanic acid biosynthesis acetyltransferase WcaF
MLKIDLSKFDNRDYWKQQNFGKLRIFIWFMASNVFINSYLPVPLLIKIVILQIFGAKIGRAVMIKPKVNIKYPWFLEIGDNTWIGEEVWIDNLCPVKIGANVCISQGAMLLTGNHDYKKETFDLITGNIILEDGVWIGAKSVVCPNVICFSHAVLAVGSITTKNLESYQVYQGNPATKIRNRV